MTAERFVSGQRWLSNNEPELGLGLVISASRGRVSILFPAVGQTRQYTATNAPLTRIRFSEGEQICSHEGAAFTVERVSEREGVLTYHTGGRDMAESELADSLNLTRPLDRLLNAQIDDKGLFNLRSKCLHHRFETLRGHQRGFVGPRIELIPHQLFAALQIRRKGVPRLVLADESGLGKSIEAGLVLHRLLVTSRIESALIAVPAASLSRWHFELVRRFHLPVVCGRAMDGPLTAKAVLVLCPFESLADASARRWDLMIVDDADAAAVDPKAAEALAALCSTTPGVILLTDLPPQTETEAHARLQALLDSSGVTTIESASAAAFCHRLQAAAAEAWSDEDRAELEALAGIPVDSADLTADNPDGRERLIAAVLESVGAGRRLLRNSRATVEGLPEREALPEKLAPAPAGQGQAIIPEFLRDGTPNPHWSLEPDDPRLAWISRYIEENPRDKIVLICATREKVAAIAGALGERVALHHEGLDLAARDQAVQRFTEKDGRGAHILACSEIGAEARSLPFAHHLILFDLPPDPVCIQKRIGNLDRFGHMAKVRVHIPYIEGTPEEVIFRWFHEALHLFERTLPVVHACSREFADRFRAASLLPAAEAASILETLLPQAQSHADELKARLESSGDRLTDLASFRPLPAQRLLETVRRLDSDLSLDFLMLRLFDHFGFDAEDVGERTYHVRPREKDRNPDAFPAIVAGGQQVTFERQKALARDDLAFLTWDHPDVLGHAELLLSTIQGNSCYAVWEDLRSQIVLLEALFRVELADPLKRLYPARFFSPAGVRLIIDHELTEVGADYPMELINKNVRNGRREWIRHNNAALRVLLPRMLENLSTRATERAAELSTRALTDLETQMVPELDRLKRLQKAGGPASDLEISLIEEEIATLRSALARPVVTLDSLRLVRRGPAGKGI